MKKQIFFNFISLKWFWMKLIHLVCSCLKSIATLEMKEKRRKKTIDFFIFICSPETFIGEENYLKEVDFPLSLLNVSNALNVHKQIFYLIKMVNKLRIFMSSIWFSCTVKGNDFICIARIKKPKEKINVK